MIKLVAIDLDGTLFNSHQQISEVNKFLVKQALECGVQTAIVTGRGKAGAITAMEMLGIEMPVICSAGSLIFKNHGSEIISARTIQIVEELTRIVDFARRHDAGLIADSLVGNWWFGPDELGESLDPLTAAYAWHSRRTLTPEIDFLSPMLKITLVADPEILHQAEDKLCLQCPSLNHVYAGMRYIDLTRIDVNKGSALEILANYLGIDAEETAAIGDQLIDLSMLEFSQHAIAMENAPAKLKQIADWVAPSNDEDGVAWALERILINNNENDKMGNSPLQKY
jgi:Cof subfamily protein (haloacid dehalogenase superfamily)